MILDGTVVRVRLDGKAISISLQAVPGVRRDRPNVLRSARDVDRESGASWRSILDDLIALRCRTPKFLITNGSLLGCCARVPIQTGTVRFIMPLLGQIPGSRTRLSD